MIFLIATDEPVSWSFAELETHERWVADSKWGRMVPDETECPCEQVGERERWRSSDVASAPIPTGCRST